MNYLYSLETKGFYHKRIHSEIPKDAIEISDDEYRTLLSKPFNTEIVLEDNKLVIKEIIIKETIESIIASYDSALKTHFDSIAKSYGYDNRITFSLRAGYEGPYQKEGIAFAQWMDSCYVSAYTYYDTIKVGKQKSNEDFINSLPKFIKPE